MRFHLSSQYTSTLIKMNLKQNTKYSPQNKIQKLDLNIEYIYLNYQFEVRILMTHLKAPNPKQN